ncbi:uncharacterized protein PGTG_21306 [Puccinia graminis f. sp. tritici CRL 75-36-700-3]|uniref:Uncharacterized protein n=1 Tax=Puccinia graminis f. sp. tritici (strain CRL 75-36-700-3 / race SCCL) TaxID=418459 RepID=H6QR39_PUCGT|nr:uncharacterized protein PGTG_21306 [Puccinia graminis f. sp. tritici CRL 75-36-700-3]EHS63014.1 hypothetical protein PGTG_21306 [Puccinia graminis f. sp. tritici CRL 75-36-700-3]
MPHYLPVPASCWLRPIPPRAPASSDEVYLFVGGCFSSQANRYGVHTCSLVVEEGFYVHNTEAASSFDRLACSIGVGITGPALLDH